MASSNCGGIKSPVCRPFPVIPGLLPNHFPAGQWVKVIDWAGLTVQTLVHKVSATPASAVVKWRRKSTLTPVTEGSFQGETDFNVYPTDLTLTVELWVDDPTVTVTVDFHGAVSWTPPPSP
jgi:hypothetical protein